MSLIIINISIANFAVDCKQYLLFSATANTETNIRAETPLESLVRV